MDLQLRDECKSLLSKLQLSQKSMKEKLELSKQSDLESSDYHNSTVKFGTDITGNVNVGRDADSDLKPTYARHKLLSLSKAGNENNNHENLKPTCDVKNKENQHKPVSLISFENNQNEIHLSSCHENQHDSVKDLNNKSSNSEKISVRPPSSTTAASPSRIRKRQIINRHTAVPSSLSPEELKELDDERLLNFNYNSHMYVDKLDDIQYLSTPHPNHCEQKSVTVTEKESSNLKSVAPSKEFKKQLQDEGNDRRHHNWLKDTNFEPRTILNSSDYYSLAKKKNNSRVRFNSSSNEDVQIPDQRLLGYDWIAALLDNERTTVDQSESFFDEICDFRIAFKEECNNKFYKESPYTLVDREPEPVVEALTEPKVQPFTVNERLFTEPLNNNLIYDDHDFGDKKTTSKEPTKDNPRFVRVSIPRSTLQTPYRVKPHRRGSFDGSDSCALMDHCLLGWENTVPSMLPPAKSLSLAADAGTQINSQTTTLAEAERLATHSNQAQWHLARPTSHAHILPRWRKHYMDTTLNLSLPSSVQQASNSSTLNHSSVPGRENVKRTTDRILQATYSTMYEMERLRRQRDLEKDVGSQNIL